MKTPIGRWFRQIWPTRQRRLDVLSQYVAAGAQSRLMLTDIGLRGRVWSDLEAESDRQTFINIGRRQLALEILELSGASFDQLYDLIERAPTKGDRDA